MNSSPPPNGDCGGGRPQSKWSLNHLRSLNPETTEEYVLCTKTQIPGLPDIFVNNYWMGKNVLEGMWKNRRSGFNSAVFLLSLETVQAALWSLLPQRSRQWWDVTVPGLHLNSQLWWGGRVSFSGDRGRSSSSSEALFLHLLRVAIPSYVFGAWHKSTSVVKHWTLSQCSALPSDKHLSRIGH